MKEMKIKIIMDDNHDITITNESTSKKTIIDFEKKSLNAAKIYDVLDYNTDSSYRIESNIDEIEDSNEKDYFYEIVEILIDIANELNNLNSPDNEADSDNSDAEEFSTNNLLDDL